uniref:Uncharacterized protein n=1 Tax=uncultured marine group II/III euryarchaeote KM3_13_G01 TaxID=1457873 RepID=A0A075GH12_9EURY|nr:hypothetical protein [uncultured marine group II/III euryarchaeote KM3_13_G01]
MGGIAFAVQFGLSVNYTALPNASVVALSPAVLNKRGYSVMVSTAGFEPANLGSIPSTLATHSHAWACDCNGEHLGWRTPRFGFDSRHALQNQQTITKKEVIN